MTVSNTAVLIVGNDFVDFPNARRIAVGEGLAFSDGGGQGPYTISPGGRLSSLANNVTKGYISFNATSQTYVSRTISGGAGIVVTDGDGVSGNTSISQIPSSVVQRVNVIGPLGSPGNYSNIKFAAGAGMSLTVVDEGSGGNALVTYTNTHGDEGSVDSVNANSSTGVLVTATPGLPITESGTIHINLPGSGALDAVVEGDMLIGGNAGEYDALNLADSEVVFVVGSTNSASLPPDIYTENGTGTVTIYNEWDTTDLTAGNMLVTCGDTSGITTTVAPSLSLYGYKGTNSSAAVAIKGYASNGDSASGGTVILDGETLLDIGAYGKYTAGAGNFAYTAAIRIDADDDYSASDYHPSVIRFMTSGGGDTDALNRMQVNSNGTVTCFNKLFATELQLTSAPLPSGSGGTGIATVAEGDILIGSASNSFDVLNLADPEVALGLGLMVANNPLNASLGDGTLTILNQFAAPDANAGNLVLAVGDTSAASNVTVSSNVVSFSGTATDLAAHRFYAAGGSASSPAALATTENVAIEFWGQYDSTVGHYAKAASIVFAADAAFSATDEHQSSISFKVSPTGETDPLDALVISPDLSVTIPGTLNAGSLDLGAPLPTTEGGSGANYANGAALFQGISPITSQGDTIVGGALGVPQRLAGNASATIINFMISLNNTSSWTQSIWQQVGVETSITTTRVVNTPFAGTGSTRIQLNIKSMAGSPTVSPSCYLGTVVPGVSFEIVPVAVGGGGGEPTSIDVLWTISYG